VISSEAEIQSYRNRDVLVVMVTEAEPQLKDEYGGDGTDDAGHGGVGQGLVFDGEFDEAVPEGRDGHKNIDSGE
jgi:hypothetical protein